jgi:hypothetical protein
MILQAGVHRQSGTQGERRQHEQEEATGERTRLAAAHQVVREEKSAAPAHDDSHDGNRLVEGDGPPRVPEVEAAVRAVEQVGHGQIDAGKRREQNRGGDRHREERALHARASRKPPGMDLSRRPASARRR